MAGSSPNPSLRVVRLTPERREDFYRLHRHSYRNGWCQCVAWWVPVREGWDSRTAEQNRALRQKLFAEGVDDGYLAYEGDEPVGWCQAWRRDAFQLLRSQFKLPLDKNAWMIGCFFIAPSHRRRGVAKLMLAEILADLKQRGAATIDAFPKRKPEDADDLWNGPESIFASAGFDVVRDDAKRPLLRRHL